MFSQTVSCELLLSCDSDVNVGGDAVLLLIYQDSHPQQSCFDFVCLSVPLLLDISTGLFHFVL